MKYYINKQNGMIYKSISGIVVSMLSPWSGDFGDTAFRGDPTSRLKDIFRPISKQTVQFFIQDGGYDNEYFKS